MVEVRKGQTTAHVGLDVNGAVVTAAITNEPVDELGLEVGREAYAVVKASNVMVAADDRRGNVARPNEIRAGETAIEIPLAIDASLVSIGHIHTPWTDRSACPCRGRSDGPIYRIEVFEPWLTALDGITEYARLEVIYWLHLSRRDLVRQCPRNGGIAPGTFSLRTPVRPNPLGIQLVGLVRLEGANLFVHGLDCIAGTPHIDLKPDRDLFTSLAPRQPGDDQVRDAE